MGTSRIERRGGGWQVQKRSSTAGGETKNKKKTRRKNAEQAGTVLHMIAGRSERDKTGPLARRRLLGYPSRHRPPIRTAAPRTSLMNTPTHFFFPKLRGVNEGARMTH